MMGAGGARGGGAPAAVVADANADAPVRAALDGGGTRIDRAAVSTETQR